MEKWIRILRLNEWIRSDIYEVSFFIGNPIAKRKNLPYIIYALYCMLFVVDDKSAE